MKIKKKQPSLFKFLSFLIQMKETYVLNLYKSEVLVPLISICLNHHIFSQNFNFHNQNNEITTVIALFPCINKETFFIIKIAEFIMGEALPFFKFFINITQSIMSKNSNLIRHLHNVSPYKQSQSAYMQKKQMKIPTVHQKRFPIHYHYFSSHGGPTSQHRQKPQLLQFWGCIVPKENSLIIKKKLERACSVQLGRKKQKISMNHSKMSSQLMLEKYLQRKKIKQRKQVFIRPQSQKDDYESSKNLLSARTTTSRSYKRAHSPIWKHTCLTTDMTDGDGKWADHEKSRKDEDWSFTQAIDEIQHNINYKFNRLEDLKSQVKSIRNRHFWDHN